MVNPISHKSAFEHGSNQTRNSWCNLQQTVAPQLHPPCIRGSGDRASGGNSCVASSPATSQEVSRPEAGQSNHWACPKVLLTRKQLELAGNGHVSKSKPAFHAWFLMIGAPLGLDTPRVVPSAAAPRVFLELAGKAKWTSRPCGE
eukprot:s5125_g2.t1